MKSVAKGLERRWQRGEVGGAVRFLCQGAGEVARGFKEHVLQDAIERSVRSALGKPRGLRRRRPTGWACGGCGPRHGDQVRRNGHYRRRPLVCEGRITLRIPQLVCLDCGKSVPFRHPLLPRRKRLWLDIDQEIVRLYLEGWSYRAICRLLARRCRSGVGLMTAWRSLQATATARHAPAARPPAHYLALDEVYHRVKGEKRWFLSVRAQDAGGGKHWVGSVLADDRSQDAWETALVELGISRYNPPFAVISDGDQAIEAAVQMTLPGVKLQRCTWHLKHNAAGWIREHYPGEDNGGQRAGLMAAVHAIVDAASLEQRQQSLDVIGENFPWLAAGLAQALDRVPPDDGATTVRTNNLMERGFRELRRRTRPMDGFGSDQGASNFHLLWMLKENARLNGRDYLPELIP